MEAGARAIANILSFVCLLKDFKQLTPLLFFHVQLILHVKSPSVTFPVCKSKVTKMGHLNDFDWLLTYQENQYLVYVYGLETGTLGRNFFGGTLKIIAAWSIPPLHFG